MARALEVRGLRAGYGKITVLWDVDLHADEGELVTIIGANGAGKTTLLRAITGLLDIHRGKITRGSRQFITILQNWEVGGWDALLPDSIWLPDYAPNSAVGTVEHLAELCELVKKVVGYGGRISYDRSMPDGTPRKVLDVSRINSLGWRPRITLRSGIEATYSWYLSNR